MVFPHLPCVTAKASWFERELSHADSPPSSSATFLSVSAKDVLLDEASSSLFGRRDFFDMEGVARESGAGSGLLLIIDLDVGRRRRGGVVAGRVRFRVGTAPRARRHRQARGRCGEWCTFPEVLRAWDLPLAVVPFPAPTCARRQVREGGRHAPPDARAEEGHLPVLAVHSAHNHGSIISWRVHLYLMS